MHYGNTRMTYYTASTRAEQAETAQRVLKTLGLDLFALVSCMIMYHAALFRCLGTLSYTASKWVLYGLIACFALPPVVRWLRGRGQHPLNSTGNLVFPFGLYTVCAYAGVCGRMMTTVLLLALTGALLYWGMANSHALLGVIRRWRYAWGYRRAMMSTGSLESLLQTKISCYADVGAIQAEGPSAAKGRGAFCMAVRAALWGLMGIIAFSTLMGHSLVLPRVNSTEAPLPKNVLLAENLNAVLLLQEDKWAQLDIQTRTDVMQTVLNIEARDLGLTEQVELHVVPISAEKTMGYYTDGRRAAVYVNIDLMEHGTAAAVLDTCCHELFHCYEYRLVDAYMQCDENSRQLKHFQSAADYARDFGRYVNPSRDYDDYYNQRVESDARDYAMYTVMEYRTWIGWYLMEEQ